MAKRKKKVEQAVIDAVIASTDPNPGKVPIDPREAAKREWALKTGKFPTDLTKVSDEDLAVLMGRPSAEQQRLVRREIARRAGIEEAGRIQSEAHFAPSYPSDPIDRVSPAKIRRPGTGPVRRRGYKEGMADAQVDRLWRRDVNPQRLGAKVGPHSIVPPPVDPHTALGLAAAMEREAPRAGPALGDVAVGPGLMSQLKGWHQGLKGAKGVKGFVARNPLLVGGAAMFAAPMVAKALARGLGGVMDSVTGAGKEDELEQQRAERSLVLAQQMRMKRLKRDMQENAARLMQVDPALAQELMAGRRLPKGATVIGGRPREDLLMEAAAQMAEMGGGEEAM